MATMEPHLTQPLMQLYESSLKVILESRIPALNVAFSSHHGGSSTSTLCGGPAFNLILGKFCPGMHKREPWCQGMHEPMLIDIWCRRKARPAECLLGNFETPCTQEKPVLLERWTLHFTGHSMEGDMHLPNTRSPSNDSKHGSPSRRLVELLSVRRNAAILLRSIYSAARLLPSQGLFWLSCTKANYDFEMFSVVSATPSIEPVTTRQEMTDFFFAPIECNDGLFCVSVAYRNVVPTVVLKEMPSLQITKIITNYMDTLDSSYSNDQFQNVTFRDLHSPSPSSVPKLRPLNFYGLHECLLKEKAQALRSWVSRNEVLDLPFAIDDLQDDRASMESARLKTTNSDPVEVLNVGGGHNLGIVMELLSTSVPLRESLLQLNWSRKTVAEALKELRSYIDVRDSLIEGAHKLHRC